MKADQGFYSLAKRLYYRSESDVPYWPAEEHPSKKKNEWEAGPVYIARVIFTSPPTYSSIQLFEFRL